MELKNYFEKTEGTGILSTSDDLGHVNSAIYARPHFMEDGTLAFIMTDRLSHRNLQSNPHASYLFMEKNGKYQGKRLYLTKITESDDQETIQKMRRKTYLPEDEAKIGKLFLVNFYLERERPLLG